LQNHIRHAFARGGEVQEAVLTQQMNGAAVGGEVLDDARECIVAARCFGKLL
jgi:hypothetical protein